MISASPDFLRLLSVPLLAWAAWSDYQVRRVESRVWPILIAIGGIAAIWQITQIAPINSPEDAYMHRRLVGVPVGMALISAFLFSENAIGGADAKALFSLGLLFPAIHQYTIPVLGIELPLIQGMTGSLAVTIVVNGFVFGAFYPLQMWVKNLSRGERKKELFFSKPVAVSDLTETVGKLIINRNTDDEFAVDADAIRMYLRWRGETIQTLRARGESLRSPETIAETYEVGTGAIKPNANCFKSLPTTDETSPSERTILATERGSVEDTWGVERFVDEVDHNIYETTADELRAVLNYLCDHDEVHVQPAYPLIVPIFLGLLAALTIGDIVVLWMYLIVSP
ncbi:prepilin peptidase [Haloarcula sp. H-GB5]